MKRLNCKIIALLIILTFILSGCNSSGGDSVPTEVPMVPAEFLEHELNVIDDIYRTYYEVFVYSFYDSDGDGIGDIKGLTSKLNYIEEMGFNGIWLMPIMSSTTYHKYDVIDYYEIDPEYGTMDDFKEFMAECEVRGIKVIIDLVLNHTSTKHKWFLEASNYIKSLSTGEEASVKDCEYFGYYNFQKDKSNSGTFHRIGNSDYYYEGMFWDQMPDLNLENESLRSEIEDIIDFWLDLGVGGFRLDAVKEFYTGQPEKNIEVLTWFVDYVKGKDRENYMVAEVWDSFQVFPQYYASGIDSVFNFAFADADGKIVKTLNYTGSANSANSYAKALVTLQDRIKGYNADAIDAPFLTNHDLARAAGLLNYNSNKLKIASALNLLMSGNAFVYYGEEIGMSGSGKDENKRAPMYWSDTNMNGMTDGPKDMEARENRFASLEEQLADPLSIVNYYKHVIRLRNENPEIARGTVAVMEEIIDEDIAAYTKTYNGSTLLILMNLSDIETKSVLLDSEKYSYEGIRNFLCVDIGEVTLNGDELKMPPYSFVILK